MKKIFCNYCGRDDAEVVNRGPDLLLNRPGEFRLVRCRNCGLIYQNPQLTLEELSEHYPDDYQPYQRNLSTFGTPIKKWSNKHEMSRRYKWISGYFPQPGKLLEVGCSTGTFLAAMRERGWQVTGVEPSPYAADYARKNFDLEVFTGTLELANLPATSFDVVTFWDVLEHVIDPKNTLAETARVLNPGGLFVASLPNPDSVEARLFGSHWVGWDRPRHINLFTPDVIQRYLQDTGFKSVEIKSPSGRLGVTLMSLEFLARARGIPEKKWRPWIKAAYSWPLRLATWPLYKLGGALNCTSIMTVFARLEET